MPARTLKRTISKCSMDSDVPSKKAANARDWYDPVLLPRGDASSCATDEAEDSSEPEISPMLFDFEEHGTHQRYYESVMDSTPGLVSPSPPLVLYPQHKSTGELQFLTASTLHDIFLKYLQDVFDYCGQVGSMTFAQLGQTLQSLPYGLRYIQTIVRDRLGASWDQVGSLVNQVVAFISDHDIREATVSELVDFITRWKDVACAFTGDVLQDASTFFRDLLQRFKQYLVKAWIATGRIDFPCEFGKKSDTLFLCMECHREHH